MYELKQCRTGEVERERKTTVEISEMGGELKFHFVCENCKYYCPYENYNDIHSRGDICEILIGSDPMRTTYYEIEISPKNKLMLAKMTYKGENEKGPILGLDFVKEPFVKTEVNILDNGYEVIATFPKEAIKTGDGVLFFNAYRIDTDGGKFLKEEMYLLALNPTMRGKFHTPKYFLPLEKYI